MKAHQHNAYCGDEFCFHGAYTLKAEAVKKEKATPGAFIKRLNYPPYSISDQRYAVLTKATGPQATGKKNPLFSRRQKRKFRQRARQAVRGFFGFRKPIRFASGPEKKQPRAVHSSSSGVRDDVIDAIAPLYKISRSKAAQMVPAAQGGDTFDSLFRRVMAKARRNPDLTASEKRALEFYRNFHGHDPDKVIKREATIIESGDFAKLGEFLGYDLLAFNCASMHRLTRTWPFKDRVTGYRAPNVLTEGSGIKLCGANIEEVKPGELVCHQLLIIGGRQDLEWALTPEFGIESTTQFVDLGPIKNIWYFATKKQDNHEGRWYHHTFGEEEKSAEDRNAAMPYLMYDRKGKKQFIVGGNYSIPMEGIRN